MLKYSLPERRGGNSFQASLASQHFTVAWKLRLFFTLLEQSGLRYITGQAFCEIKDGLLHKTVRKQKRIDINKHLFIYLFNSSEVFPKYKQIYHLKRMRNEKLTKIKYINIKINKYLKRYL